MNSNTDMGEYNGEQETLDTWANCCIRETFDLPVSGNWIASTMKWTGEAVQSKGPPYFKGKFVDMVPRLDNRDAGLSLTWGYADHPYPKAWIDVIQWRFRDNDSGTTVEAFCKNEWGRTLYYQLKKAAKEMAKRHNTGKDSHTEVDQREEQAQLVSIKSRGRDSLLANYWAYAQTVLGHSTENILQGWQELYQWETGKEPAELADPLESMKKGIAAVAKKHRKK